MRVHIRVVVTVPGGRPLINAPTLCMRVGRANSGGKGRQECVSLLPFSNALAIAFIDQAVEDCGILCNGET